MIKNGSATLEEIESAIEESNAHWHHLFIITSNSIEDGRRELVQDDFRNFCTHIKLLVVGAYSGKGFVFWEPSPVRPHWDYLDPQGNEYRLFTSKDS